MTLKLSVDVSADLGHRTCVLRIKNK